MTHFTNGYYLFFLMLFFKLIYLLLAVLGLRCCATAFTCCGERGWGGYSSLQCAGFSWWLLLLWSTGSRRAGFSSCGARAQQLWRTGLVALRHAGSSRTRAGTRVPCIGRRILNHCATREAPAWVLKPPLPNCDTVPPCASHESI